MEKASTISDIARIAGCAPTTVSRFLNHTGYVGEKTAEKISLAIEDLDYRPNFLARSLRNRMNKTIFMAVPNIENPFFASFYRVVQSMATQSGYFLIAYNTSESAAEEIRVLSSALELNVCGIIFFSDNFTEELLKELEKTKIPSVINYYEPSGFDSVHGIKNRSSYIATKHLIDLGHRSIGFVGGEENTVVERSRLNGFINAMNEMEIPYDSAYMVEGQFTIAAGKAAGEYYLTLGRMPSAICCANDMLALGLITCFNEHGIKVPSDVSVVGIDNIIYGEANSPPLTSVTSDPELFAKSALSMLLSRITEEYTGGPREICIEHQLIIRGSTAQFSS